MTEFPGLNRFVERWGGIGPLACLTLGALLAAIALLWTAAHWLGAPNWVSTEGQVVQAGVDSSTYTVQGTRTSARPTHQEVRYSASIAYSYRVGGRDYTGHGIGDGADWSYSSHASAADALRPYGRGSVTVYYDPSDPERSALDTNIFGIVPLLLGGAGLLLLGAGFGWRRARGAAASH